jgi:acetyltransferase
LVFSPKHGSFEFGILIADDWQGKGLGTLMTRYCLDVARARRVKRVIATTTPSNSRMIKVFRNEGFLFDCDWTAGVVRVHKELSPLASRSRGSHCEDTSLPRSA